MADIARMESALRNAHKAGDVAAAKQIANALKAARGQSSPVSDANQELSAMSQGFDAPQEDVYRNVRANMEATKLAPVTERGAFAASAPRMPFQDEIGAAMMTPVRMVRDKVGPQEAYGRQVALEREIQSRKRENHPVASIVGDVAGGVPLGGMASKVAPAASGMGRALAEGAAFGAVYGADEADGKNIGAEAARGAAVGAGLSGAAGVAGKALQKRTQAALPTIDDMAQAGRSLYDEATNAGVAIKPGAIKRATGNLAIKLRSFGFDPDLQPKTAIALRRLVGASDQPLSLTELDNIRKIANTASREALEASDRKAAGMIVSEIDSIIDNAGNFTGNTNKALPAIKQAREVWKRKLKMEALEEINEKAMNQATGYENGLVIHLRALANNKKRLRAFSPDEQKLIKDAVRRGGARAALKAFGMLSPTSTFGGIATGATGVGMGVFPGVAMGGIGYGSRKAAEAMTRRQFTGLQNAVARGFVPNGDPRIARVARRFIPAATAGSTEILP